MTKKIVMMALVACLVSKYSWAQESIPYLTQSQLKHAGFSNSIISRVKRNSVNIYSRKATASPVWAQQDNLPPIADPGDSKPSSDEPILNPIPQPAEASPSNDQPPADSPSTEPAQDIPPPTPLEPPPSQSRKYKSNAPLVQSQPYGNGGSGNLPSPYAYSAPSSLQGSYQEIYSQEPLKLPPISRLPEPSRVTLPPISRDTMMTIPLGEAYARVLACNFMGLTGLIQTIGADISREGSFKMGFHTNWFNLDRVYDRPLASKESGEIFEAPIYFNYAVTNDLEFAFLLPVINYTIQSRILWAKDFRESGVGDIKLSFKYRIFDNNQYQMRGAFGLGFKFPTGSDEKGLGTGKTDFEVFTAFSKNFDRIIAHLNLGYVMTGDPNTQFYPNGLADIFYYNIGLEYPHVNNLTVMTEINGQDWGAEGLKIDITPGLRYTPTDNFAFEVGVPISVTNDQRYGYNYRLTFGVTAFFR